MAGTLTPGVVNTVVAAGQIAQVEYRRVHTARSRIGSQVRVAVQHRAAHLSAAVLPQAGVGVLHCLRAGRQRPAHVPQRPPNGTGTVCHGRCPPSRPARKRRGRTCVRRKAWATASAFSPSPSGAPLHPFLREARRAGSSAGFPRAGGSSPAAGNACSCGRNRTAQQRLHRGIARRRLSIKRPRPGGAQRPAQQEGSIAPSAPFRRDRAAENFPLPGVSAPMTAPFFSIQNTRLRRGAQRISAGASPWRAARTSSIRHASFSFGLDTHFCVRKSSGAYP